MQKAWAEWEAAEEADALAMANCEQDAMKRSKLEWAEVSGVECDPRYPPACAMRLFPFRPPLLSTH